MSTNGPTTTTSHILGGHENGTTLIARAEALDHFMKMQPAADQARHINHGVTVEQQRSTAVHGKHGIQPSPRAKSQNVSPVPSPSHVQQQHQQQQQQSPNNNGRCFCFGAASSYSSPSSPVYQQQYGGSSSIGTNDVAQYGHQRPRREYYPDNLSVQPEKHEWTNGMEWLIVACIDFLECHGLQERNIFAVSAVDDLVRSMNIPLQCALPNTTDPHVAAGVIKDKIRYTKDPLIGKQCLRDYIESHASNNMNENKNNTNDNSTSGIEIQEKVDQFRTLPKQHRPGGGSSSGNGFGGCHLLKTIDDMSRIVSFRRAYILARFMRLLGRVSANIEHSKMNAHCLAKCVAPSMLHWDPNSNFSLLMLGKITAYVMDMIEDARVFDEQLCIKIDQLEKEGGGW